MRDAPATLAKVIAKAVKDAGWRFGYTHSKLSSKPATDYIAAAVTAHALGDAAVERAAMVLRDQYEAGWHCPAWSDLNEIDRQSFMDNARAAIAAALDATGGRDGGE